MGKSKEIQLKNPKKSKRDEKPIIGLIEYFFGKFLIIQRHGAVEYGVFYLPKHLITISIHP